MSESNKPLTIAHFSADRLEHVCSVIRVIGPAKLAGVDVLRGNDWQGGELHLHPEIIKNADLVIIQRDFAKFSQAYQLVISESKKWQKNIVFDIDDLLIELPPTHPDYSTYNRTKGAILSSIVEADAITCSTSNIAENISIYNPNTIVLPNYLNDTLWTIRTDNLIGSEKSNQVIVIGYLGARSHSPDFAFIQPVLEKILLEHGDEVMLRIWGMEPPPTLKGHNQVEWLDIGLVDYAQFASYFSRQTCDIFIAPLVDNTFNRNKSNLKFLEYSALGVPGVYSSVAPYTSVITHGENGLLAASLEEWEQSLEILLSDPILRKRMGQSALETIQKDWLLSDHIDSWVNVFHSINHKVDHRGFPDFAQTIARKFYAWNREIADELEILEEDIDNKQRAIDAMGLKINGQQRLISLYNEQIQAIQNSRGWNLLEFLYRFRLTLFPHKSSREKTVQVIFQTLRILRNEGLRSLGSRFASSIRGRSLHPILNTRKNQIYQPDVKPAEFRCSNPAISVIIENNSVLPKLEQQKISGWVNSQSLDSTEIVVWDANLGKVINLSNGKNWPATTFRSVLSGIDGKYIVFASEDLLRQSETYLEANLITLESEGLLFTVNVLGAYDWATCKIDQSLLPGDRLHPLFRIVARKECVTDNYTLNISDALEGSLGFPVSIGKVISHTTSSADIADQFLLETKVSNAMLLLHTPYICSSAENIQENSAIFRQVYSVDSVMPRNLHKSSLPTVFLIMPFLAVGGAEQIHLKIMQQLSREIRFVVITFEALDDELGTMADAFRQVTPFVYTLPDYAHPDQYQSIMTYFIDKYQPDTIYIANGSCWIYDNLSFLKSNYPNIRIVDQVYDSIVGWINRYDPGVILNTDGYIGVNSGICQAYINKGAEPDQVFLIENGIDATELEPNEYNQERISTIKEKLGIPKENKVVTFASRLHQQKRPLDFVELSRRFTGEQGLTFLMVGDGSLSEIVDNQVGKIGGTNFRRIGFYRPISDILAISNLLVLPSEFEGMPMIILEAQVMGVPLVTTNVGNNEEVIDFSGGGIVIDQIGDIDALANATTSLLDTPPDPKKLRETILSRYDIRRTARKYYSALLGTSHD